MAHITGNDGVVITPDRRGRFGLRTLLKSEIAERYLAMVDERGVITLTPAQITVTPVPRRSR